MEFFQQMNQETVIRVVLLASLALVLIGLSQKVIPWIADRLSGRHRLYLLATVPLTRLVIILASVWMIIAIVVDPKAQNIFALLGTLGLALGFAFKDYVGSLIAGIVTLYEQPYRLGDWISVDEVYGEVKSIGMRSYEILTPDDTVVVIPHLKLWGGKDLQCQRRQPPPPVCCQVLPPPRARPQAGNPGPGRYGHDQRLSPAVKTGGYPCLGRALGHEIQDQGLSGGPPGPIPVHNRPDPEGKTGPDGLGSPFSCSRGPGQRGRGMNPYTPKKRAYPRQHYQN
ncbi:mechanosensitive ion channel family protein [Desulfobacter sp. UBA2225]|uniref:mechanosensitive ion channel family protein n=1 Tax=Desulfobacter sp. UBA2225 TaxID=1961413 RepID=UPI00257AA241|nr:mechanosensitive ion channel domain-containing protein [Desulfobacter sp. UBA2225]